MKGGSQVDRRTHGANEDRERAGRPRDKTIDRRARTAAIEVFAEFGWKGFTVDEVARRAGVGRPSIYRRWPDRESLLVDALRSSTPVGTSVPDGTFLEGMRELVSEYQQVMAGSRGWAGLRVFIEQEALPDVFSAVLEQITVPRERVIEQMLAAAIKRGEVRPDVSVRTVSRLLLGAILADRLYDGLRGADRDAELVDMVVDYVADAVAP